MPSKPAKTSGETRRLTEFLLSDIVAIAADAIICIDAEQRITLFNDGAEQIFGWTADEMMGKPLDLLLPERFRAGHRAHVDRFGRSNENARRMGERREIAGLRENGEEFPAEAAIAKVHMGDNVVYSVVLRDITEQVQLHKRLQRAVRARDETVGVVAHDLRNPVSAVKMLAAALMAGEEWERLSAERKERVRLIREAALQMDRLIQDLLDVTRVESGRLAINPQPLTTVALLDGALQTLRPLVEQAGVTLGTSVPSALPKVSADPERVGQVLSNLIGNSLKFTPAGGRIDVTAARDGDMVRVSVRDTGAGISREQLPHLFERYWEGTPSAIRSKGAGLGLPISKGIVAAHGGRIWVESEPGQGATFHFTLPVER
jgi:PAS domain S-box-containing protein